MANLKYDRPTYLAWKQWKTRDSNLPFPKRSSGGNPSTNAMDERVASYDGDNNELQGYARTCLFGGSLSARERGRASYLLGEEESESATRYCSPTDDPRTTDGQ